MTPLRVSVFISGRGSNLQALIGACAAEACRAEVVLVISSHAEAPGLDFAAAAEPLLLEHKVELICLAGFMRVLDPSFVEAWRDRMVNIHPSLLPAFRGLHAQRQALAAGVRFAGCTVHFVRPELDCGPIIGQAVVPVHADDDEAALATRILAVEHRLYPLALRLIAERRVRVVSERVEIVSARAPVVTALNPQDCPGDALA